jgi:two-component system sensor histidine kinase CpxA
MQLPGRPSLFFASPYRTLLRVLGALCVAGVLCYGLARYLTAPLRNLQRSARALAGGNLSARVGPDVDRRRDEIGDLGQDFNFMAGRLESLVSSQQRLILDMSHELRSPLARLNLALGLAVQRSGAEAQSALDRIGRETERLNDLIERMLILARLQNREAAGEAIELDLSGMLHDVTADAEFEARAQNRAVLLTRCDPCTIRGIPHLLRSAVENVVRNALRHTAESTEAEVSLDLETSPAPVAVIQVRDHGPGVPEGQLEHIFRPFCRVEDDRNRQTGGVGLGLAIAREAVRLHGGTIQAANAPQGGLVVTIRLPLATHHSLSLKNAAAPSLAS